MEPIVFLRGSFQLLRQNVTESITHHVHISRDVTFIAQTLLLEVQERPDLMGH